MKASRLVKALGSFGVLALTACSDDLGPCDQAAATELVYGPRYVVVTAGQALVHDSCGSAAFCHSSSASGDSRMGVPKSLDFDMLPAPDGWRSLIEHREAIWGAVDDGSMPPRGKGSKAVGSGQWFFDPAREAGSRRLPSIYTEEGREMVRNWLACDAPIVEETFQPQLGESGSGGRSGAGGAGAGGSGGSAGSSGAGGSGGEDMPPEAPDWSPIYAEIIEPTCATAVCHDGVTRAGLLEMTDECDALEALRGSGPCGLVRVTPGDVDASFLLDKLQNMVPACGSRMPPISPLLDGEIARITEWVEAGAHSARCD